MCCYNFHLTLLCSLITGFCGTTISIIRGPMAFISRKLQYRVLVFFLSLYIFLFKRKDIK